MIKRRSWVKNRPLHRISARCRMISRDTCTSGRCAPPFLADCQRHFFMCRRVPFADPTLAKTQREIARTRGRFPGRKRGSAGPAPPRFECPGYCRGRFCAHVAGNHEHPHEIQAVARPAMLCACHCDLPTVAVSSTSRITTCVFEQRGYSVCITNFVHHHKD